MIYSPLEQISSLHLDYKAKEIGYNSVFLLGGTTSSRDEG
jgi:hypothetical protein